MKEFIVWAETRPAFGKQDKAVFFAQRANVKTPDGKTVEIRDIKAFIEGLDLPETLEGKPVKLTVTQSDCWKWDCHGMRVIVHIEPTDQEPPPGIVE